LGVFELSTNFVCFVRRISQFSPSSLQQNCVFTRIDEMENPGKVVRTLYVKNMVCGRCIKVVREELERLGLDVVNVELGEVDIAGAKPLELEKIRTVLEKNGFELIENKNAKLIEQIKLTILKLVQQDQSEHPMHSSYSENLSRELGHDYHYLSSLFSSVENVTIEQYTILQRIERVKELLRYGDMTLSEIAYKTGYSSVQHLSNQFRKVTGMTPSHFKELRKSLRKPLDKVVAD
jgi:AraC family transcriptional regulator